MATRPTIKSRDIYQHSANLCQSALTQKTIKLKWVLFTVSLLCCPIFSSKSSRSAIHKKSPHSAGSLEEQLIDSYDTAIAWLCYCSLYRQKLKHTLATKNPV
jgi:hypothetical protein